MAYSTTNPPQMIGQRFGGGGPALWSYSSTDAIATVIGSSYISNGDALGMSVGDGMLALNTASTLGSLAHVVNVTTGAGATLLSVFEST